MGGGEMKSPSVVVPSGEVEEKTIRVLVTSFGPFPTKNESNTSHMVSKLLPSSLTLDPAHDPFTDGDLELGCARPHADRVRIEILNPTSGQGHEGIPVEYAEVRSYVAELYDQHFGTIAEELRKNAAGPIMDFDPQTSDKAASHYLISRRKVGLVVHLGMADGWDFISVERGAYKQGFSSAWWGPLESRTGYYMIPDNAGHTILNSGPCPWLTAPMGLQTSFDVDELVVNANTRMHYHRNDTSPQSAGASLVSAQIPIKAHAEAGSYCCGFIYYESLAHCWIRERTPDVLFCHVPGYKDDASLRNGRDAIVAIIKEAITQLLARK